MDLYNNNRFLIGIRYLNRTYLPVPIPDQKMGRLSDVRTGSRYRICAVFQYFCAGGVNGKSDPDVGLSGDCHIAA